MHCSGSRMRALDSFVTPLATEHHFVQSHGSSALQHRPPVLIKRCQLQVALQPVDCLCYFSLPWKKSYNPVKPPTYFLHAQPHPSVVMSTLGNLSALMYSASLRATDCVFQRWPHQYVYPSYMCFLQKLTDLPPPEKWSLCALPANLGLVTAPSSGAQPKWCYVTCGTRS